MSQSPDTPSVASADVRLARRLDQARAALAILMVVLVLIAAAELLDSRMEALEVVDLAAVGALGVALIVHRRTHAALAERRLAREASFTRILQGLSRSVSPESVVQAIVQELRSASGVDHVVIARVRRPDGVVEVTLESAGVSTPSSRTSLRPDVLGDPRLAGRPARGTATHSDSAEEIARRVRSAYGLPFTLARPLVIDDQFAGALILSRRTRETWTESDRRLLAWAAAEVSAAFARAYAHEEAETRANIDSLTGLPNRRYFDELVSVVGPRRRAGDTLGVLMIDIDHFKRLNDRYGHATGDEVLRAVGSAIRETVRGDDTPARYGGEEFAVVLRTADRAQATEVAERIRHAVSTLPIESLGLEQPVTVSVGVAVGTGEVTSLMQRADAALYTAKRRGRDRVVVAGPTPA